MQKPQCEPHFAPEPTATWIVLVTPTMQPVRELRDEITFGQGEDCIVVTCRQLNPEKIHDVLRDLRVADIVELSGWQFQIMRDPYETNIQQLQIRPRLSSWSLQHDEFEYLLQIHIWTIVCNTVAKNRQTNGKCVDFLGHETSMQLFGTRPSQLPFCRMRLHAAGTLPTEPDPMPNI